MDLVDGQGQRRAGAGKCSIQSVKSKDVSLRWSQVSKMREGGGGGLFRTNGESNDRHRYGGEGEGGRFIGW
jgi:hypothetical protein